MLVIASELVTNAIVHGDTPLILSVSYQAPDMTVEVFDGDPRTESVRLRGADDLSRVAEVCGLRAACGPVGSKTFPTRQDRLGGETIAGYRLALDHAGPGSGARE